jgi:hypothetical protein
VPHRDAGCTALDIARGSSEEATTGSMSKGRPSGRPSFGLLRGLVVVIARRRRRPPQLEAFPAVDRLVGARLERNFCVPSALRAGRGIHLPWTARVATAATGGVPSAAAIAIARGIRSAAAVSSGGISSATTTAAIARIEPLRGALRLAGRSARRTTLGLTEPPLRIKRLLAGRKRKRLAAIAAGERPIAHSA